jgi:Tol biopolymer transport system component
VSSAADRGAPGGTGPVPERVGDFVIVSEIGRGGMGIVYRALDQRLGREVALKRPKPELMSRIDFASRFLREARTASRLLHPNITTVFAAFEHDGVPWLAMELVEGGSLRQRLQRGPISVNEIVAIAEGLADALRAAHEKGILHADINPNNILIGRDGRARLTDFGLARARNEPGEAPVFGAGEIPSWSTPEAAGTRGYMAPEHIRTGRIDERSDLYCLGLVIYEMCSGRSAFGGKNTVEWVGAVVEGTAQQLARAGLEATPPELARIVGKATSNKPKHRYQNAAEMVEDLRLIRRYSESGVEMAVADAARARKRLLYGALAAGVVVALAAAVALVRYQAKRPIALRAHPLTSAPGWEGDPALSPDGTIVAYASDETGNDEIWVMDVATRNAVKLTDDPATDRHPAWFPDGSRLAFASNRGGEWGIWTVAVSGGPARLLLARAEDPAVSPDGTRLAFAVRDAAGLMRIAVASVVDPTSMKVLTGANDGALDHRNPGWSPDGRRICYQDLRDIWVVSAEGGPARMITDHVAANWQPAWSADGRYVYFGSSREGPWAIWRIPPTGGTPERVTLGTGPEVEPSVSRSRDRIVYATLREDQDIGVREVPTGRTWRIASTTGEMTPACAPDESSVAFVSFRLGTCDLFLQRIDGRGPEGQPQRLTDLPGTVALPAFSRDGRWVAFHNVVNGERDLWIVPTKGGRAAPLIVRPGTDACPDFSPDGQSMAFVSDRDGGQHIWVSAFADGRLTGEPRQLTSGESADIAPSWSPDSRHVLYVCQHSGDSEATLIDATVQSPPRAITQGVTVKWVAWGPRTDSVLVAAAWDNRRVEVRTVRLGDGAVESEDPPIVLAPAETEPTFSVSADGRIVAFLSASTTGDIWVADGLGAR